MMPSKLGLLSCTNVGHYGGTWGVKYFFIW